MSRKIKTRGRWHMCLHSSAQETTWKLQYESYYGGELKWWSWLRFNVMYDKRGF